LEAAPLPGSYLVADLDRVMACEIAAVNPIFFGQAGRWRILKLPGKPPGLFLVEWEKAWAK